LERKVENAFSVLEWAGNMTDQPHSGCKRGLLRLVLEEIEDRQFKKLVTEERKFRVLRGGCTAA
jgi:hypothetical protein